MNSMLFVLDEIKTQDQTVIKQWSDAIDNIEGICSSIYKIGVCPQALLLARDSSDLPLIARAITVAEKHGLSYAVIFIKDGTEWKRNPA